MNTHKISAAILATLILVSFTACNNKAVPTMATVSSSPESSDVGVSSLADTMSSSSTVTSSVSSAAASSKPATSSSAKPSTSTTKPSTTTRTGGGTSYTKPSGGGGSTTHTGGGTTRTGGTTGGTTGGGTTTPTPPPAPAGISAQYHGAKYGCDSPSQYNYVMGKANAVTGSSKYASNYSFNQENQDAFTADTGLAYSDALNRVLSIRGCFSGSGSASSGSAYSYFTGSNRSCADGANALEAALHVNGINARLAWGTWNGSSHMWVQAYVNGAWYNLVGKPSTSLSSAGLSLSGSGYNY